MPTHDAQTKEWALALTIAGVPPKRIAEVLGVNAHTVRKWVRDRWGNS